MELPEFLDYAKEQADKGDHFHLRAAALLRQYPVSLREFVTSPDYLNDQSVYPANLDVLEALNNPGGLRIGTSYTEALLTGGIGSGKTTVALISLAYQAYVLNCLRSPHELFGLSDSSELALVCQAPTERLAMRVAFSRMRELVLGAKCFRGSNAPDKRVTRSELRFPSGVVIRPLSGSVTSALGQNVLGGMIDELAFAEYVERSMKTRGLSSDFDQAEMQYLTIARRRKSRFMKHGRLPGLLCLVSSPQTPDDLLSRKLEEAREDSTIFVSRKRLWDVRPNDFSKERFRVFIGDHVRPPRIMESGEDVTEPDLVEEIPKDFRRDFEKDIDSAIRDIAGRASTGVSPYMRNRAAVHQCFTGPSILKTNSVDFSQSELELAVDVFQDVHLTRWVHVDLALSRDSAGIACGYIQSFTEIEGSMLPVILIDFALEVRPPEHGEISFEKIRSLLVGLRNRGLPIRWISFDGFQSADSRQLLKAQGFETGLRSMDRTLEAYEYLRSALYDKRVLCAPHEKLQRELVELQFDARKQKIDHPARGSKDIADALAGVVHGLSTSRAARAEHGVYTAGIAQTRVTSIPALESTISVHSSAVDDLHEAFLADQRITY